MLAAALARDEELRREFPDGILWITLGQTPNLIARQMQLAQGLGDTDPQFTDTQAGKARLSVLLAERACLIVLDDVWEMVHLAVFNALGNKHSLLLFTTRNAELISFLGAEKRVLYKLKPGMNVSAEMKILLTSIIITGLLLGIRQLGWFQPLELAAYDWMVRTRPAIEPDSRLLIVKITEEDIQLRQHWPLSDQIIADTLQIISQAEPAVIGLDIHRDLPQEPGHQVLAAQLQSPRVIVIKQVARMKRSPDGACGIRG